MMTKRNFGKVEPLVFSKDEKRILFNPFTTKKIFSTQETISNIPTSELSELENGAINFSKPSIDRFRVEVDFNCDALCDYCLVYNNPIKKLLSRMDLETAKRITKRFNKEINPDPTVKKGSLMLIGGEPLLNLSVVSYFIENINGYVNIFSNGTQITNPVADILAQPHVATFISIDGREKENIYRKKRNGEPLYFDSIKGHQKLKERNARTGISCLVTENNVDSLTEIVDFFHSSLHESVFGLSFPHKNVKNNFSVDMDKYTAQLINLVDYAKDTGIFVAQIANILRPLVYNSPRVAACKIAGEQITFYPDGQETLCTKLDTLPNYAHKTTADYFTALPLMNNNCDSCEAISLCGGGCMWDSTFHKSKLDRDTCNIAKGLLEPLLWSMYNESRIHNRIVQPSDIPTHVKLLQPE
jgi:radical SAM protein with 4Fe4S-binding SPASM domain